MTSGLLGGNVGGNCRFQRHRVDELISQRLGNSVLQNQGIFVAETFGRSITTRRNGFHRQGVFAHGPGRVKNGGGNQGFPNPCVGARYKEGVLGHYCFPVNASCGFCQ